MRRHLVQIGPGDLDVIAEHRIETHLQRGNAGALHLIRLQLGDPILAAALGLAQFIQRGVKAVADHAAFLDGERRFIHDGAGYEVHQLGELGELFDQGGQQG